MAETRGERVVVLPDDDDRVVPRNQDQRGATGRTIDANKLADDVDKGLKQGQEQQRARSQDDGHDISEADGDELLKVRRELAREKRAREVAEARANQSETQTAEALDAKSISDLNTLKSAKAQLETERESLKGELKMAYAEGDFDRVAEINQRMTQNMVNANTIDNGITHIEQMPKQREALRRRGANPTDEARFAQITKGMKEPSKEWLRQNPEYYRDDVLLDRVVSAHKIVMTSREPPEPDSAEYFERVEELLDDPKFDRGTRTEGSGAGRGGDEIDDDPEEPLSRASGGQRRRQVDDDDPPPPAAPVARNGRGAGGANRRSSREVTLSRDEEEMAELTGQTPEEFARNKRALQKEGRIGPAARRNMH